MKQILILFALFPILNFGQSKIPLISGSAKFSVEKGTIECDLTLSEYSHIDDYVIRLNSGLNILNIQSLEPNDFLLGYSRSFTDSLQTSETNSYFFPSNDRRSKFLPTKLRFKYVGKYPVVKDTLSQNYQRKDWRGNIAFNNHILRTDGLQSSWIPIIYDIKNDYEYTDVRYDIEIECLDCEMLYINGNQPVKGTKARFKSDVPREMYIFLGKYNVQKSKGVTVLNTDFSNSELESFSNLNEDISDFLKTYTNISYNEHIFWVQGNTTTNYTGFAFVSYPTFTNVGFPPYDLKSTFNDYYKSGFLKTIAHELGHYYFGTLKKYNNTLENLINEGFAEFLSLKYLENKGYNEVVSNQIKQKLEYINEEGFTLQPIGKFQNLSDTNDRQTYAYDYQTLVLLSIEKEIGTEKMKQWIQLLLKEDKPTSDFGFLSQKLKETLNNDKKYQHILSSYLLGETTIQTINKVLNEK